MTTIQLEKALGKYIKGLPEDALQEILDFIIFIRQKRLKKPTENLTNELNSLNTNQTDHLEQEFKNYKQIYPNE